MILIGTADYYQPLTDFERRAGVIPPPPMPGNPCSNPACPCNASLATDPIECPDCGHPISDHHRDYQDAGCCAGGCICTLTQKDLTQEGAEQ